jgi:predicted nucleotidyltransferase
MGNFLRQWRIPMPRNFKSLIDEAVDYAVYAEVRTVLVEEIRKQLHETLPKERMEAIIREAAHDAIVKLLPPDEPSDASDAPDAP